MNFDMKMRQIAVVVSGSFLLVACAGGNAVTSPSTLPVSQVASPAPISHSETNAPAITKALNVLNTARVSCGMDALVPHPSLVSSAESANNYFKLRFAENDSTYFHAQRTGLMGFTGIMPWDRAALAGYPIASGWQSARVSENLSTTIVPPNSVLESKVENAQNQTESLMNTVYHLLALMSPEHDVGISYVEAPSPVNAQRSGRFTAHRVTIVTGTQSAIDTTAAGGNSLVTYPCQGTTAIAAFKPKLEWPNPLPDFGDALVGTPIGFRAPTGTTLSISKYAVTNDAGQVIASRLIERDGEYISANQAAIIPLTALAVGKTYRVAAVGSFVGNGFSTTPIGVDFTFKTKAAGMTAILPQ